MSERMKILVANDGSECADLALDDLCRAGLPGVAEVVVLTVADVIMPPPLNEETDNTFPHYVPEGARLAHARTRRTGGDGGLRRRARASSLL